MGFKSSPIPLAKEGVLSIKKDHYLRTQKSTSKNKSWQDQIMDAEGDGCASCFI